MSFGYCIATLLEFAGVHYFTKVGSGEFPLEEDFPMEDEGTESEWEDVGREGAPAGGDSDEDAGGFRSETAAERKQQQQHRAAEGCSRGLVATGTAAETATSTATRRRGSSLFCALYNDQVHSLPDPRHSMNITEAPAARGGGRVSKARRAHREVHKQRFPHRQGGQNRVPRFVHPPDHLLLDGLRHLSGRVQVARPTDGFGLPSIIQRMEKKLARRQADIYITYINVGVCVCETKLTFYLYILVECETDFLYTYSIYKHRDFAKYKQSES